MKLTGRNGVLRLSEASTYLHGAGPLSTFTVDVTKWNGVSTWTDITADVITDDFSYSNNFLPDNAAAVFIGSTRKFSIFQFKKNGASDYAAGSGAMIIKYFNGANFNNPVQGINDPTNYGGACFGWDGHVRFKMPRDWALGANAYNANLDADKYYIMIQTTTSSTTDADADVLCPGDSQYFGVAFSAMDFSGPIGRKLQEEILVLDRNTMSGLGHYIKGPGDLLYEPVPISFSCMIDDIYNKDAIMKALACGNPGSTYWTNTGISSKGTTKNDGSSENPNFVDVNKKCVNLQILWNGSPYAIGMAYYECYFPPDEITISEAEDGITLSAAGGCYGVIDTIHGLGNNYYYSTT
jgi:hypothetical protein